MQWRYDRPDETEPGEHVFALVVYTQSGEIGVRCLERAEVRNKWQDHVFAWRAIEYPTYSIKVMESVVAMYQEATATKAAEPASC